jgi:lipid A ethanolaminephosphotransferase
MKISHARFSILFPALLYAVCNAINIDRLSRWFQHGNGVDYVALSSYLLAGLCLSIAFFTLLAHRWTIKPLAVLLTILSAAATYFIAKYDVAIDTSMVLNTLHTDTVEVSQLLSLRMVPYVLLLMLLPAFIIVTTDITFAGRARYLLASLGVVSISLAIALASLYLNFKAIHRAGNISHKYIVYSLVPINIISSTINVGAKAVRRSLRSHEKAPDISATVSSPGNLVVVLAIGEAARRKSFSLYGYERRDTNPVLRTFDGLHPLPGIAAKGSTLYALPEILEKQGVKLPALVARAGIKTSCYVNYTLYDNCSAVGEIKVSNCGHSGKCYDEDVIPLLENDLKNYVSGYEFVVLHLGGGSHGPAYSSRIPAEFVKFAPACEDADVANRCTPEQLYNSYDNSILYADQVLGDILQALDRSGVPYVFIFLSDHGESLGEGGYLFHGMPPGMALPPEQAEIPLLVKSSIPVSIVPRSRYLQPDVFDTVLDLFSIEAPTFDKSRSFIKSSPR